MPVLGLPEDISRGLSPLLDVLPLERAMDRLVVGEAGASEGMVSLVEGVMKDRALAGNARLAAGLWLYVDELDRSHEISQGLHDATGSFWHGIMHRREGDFGNSHYWFNRVGKHPAMDGIAGYAPHAFIDAVAERHKESPQDLVDLQRGEWLALFAWCAAN